MGVHKGGFDPDLPCKNRSYPEIPWKIFNFPDPEFSSKSSRRVFCFRLRALSKTVTIDQLPRNIVPGYSRDCQGVLDANIQGSIVFCFLSNLARIYFPYITQIISYFSRLHNRNIKKFLLQWMYLIPFPATLKPTFPISRLKKWQIPHP